MIIIFLGPPEAGKGTQAELLAKRLRIPHFSVGQFLREAWNKKTKLGIEGEKYWGEKGINVPTRISFGILKKYLSRSKKGFILDNFPRTKENLDYLKKYLQDKKLKVDRVFHLSVSQKTGEKRLEKRAISKDRLDETPKLLKKRREIGYTKDVLEIKNYFKKIGVWYEIDGEKKPKEVFAQIMYQILDKPE